MPRSHKGESNGRFDSDISIRQKASTRAMATAYNFVAYSFRWEFRCDFYSIMYEKKNVWFVSGKCCPRQVIQETHLIRARRFVVQSTIWKHLPWLWTLCSVCMNEDDSTWKINFYYSLLKMMDKSFMFRLFYYSAFTSAYWRVQLRTTPKSKSNPHNLYALLSSVAYSNSNSHMLIHTHNSRPTNDSIWIATRLIVIWIRFDSVVVH